MDEVSWGAGELIKLMSTGASLAIMIGTFGTDFQGWLLV